MAFTGTAVIEQVSDGVVRVTGVSLAGGDTGSIGLHSSVLPVDVLLPVAFAPRSYPYQTHPVPLVSSLQVSIASKLPGVVTSPLAINKAGTTVEDLLILIANTSAGQGVLGRARSFGVAGGQGITNVGNTVITGDLSIFPGAPATGFPPGTVTGTQHVNDPDAFGCFADAGAAYAVLSSLVGFVDLTGQNLGGQTLSPGTYRFAADAPLTGTLVLDAAGDLNASFVFQIGTTLDVDPGAIVSLAGSAIAGQVFWTVATDATLGAGSTFEGSILAINHIGLGAGANIVAGRALIASIQGVVDLEDNEITVPSPAGANNSGELEIYIRFH